MSLFCGVVLRNEQDGITDRERRLLEQIVSRDTAQPRRVFASERYHLVHVDLGAWGSEGAVDRDGSVSLVAGDPTLCSPYATHSRQGDLLVLHEAWRESDARPFTKARGTFALAHVEGRTGRVALTTDAIGLRPLHLWIDDQRIVFSTGLRVMEALPFVPKRLDPLGVAEELTLGYCLADRTPYEGIRRIGGGLHVVIEGSSVGFKRTWCPERVPTSRRPLSSLQEDAYAAFREGVRLRRRGDRCCLSLLSGGLDSRCVVTVLRDMGADVHTLTLSYGDEQDHELGRMFADVAGTVHQRFPLPAIRKPNWALLTRRALSVLGQPRDPSQRPGLVWTGDNGSFVVGFVYMTNDCWSLLRNGRDIEAVHTYLAPRDRLPDRVFASGVGNRLRGLVHHSLARELSGIRCDDPAKRLYVLYLMTEARHVMSSWFEEIDLHRLDTPVPFCDLDLLKVMLSVPMDAGLGHAFYHGMMRCFPPMATAVPWQTYPGHQPCPHPLRPSQRTQWEASSQYASDLRRHDALLAKELSRLRPWPKCLVPRYRFKMATWAHLARLGSYGSLFRVVATLQRLWAVTGGKGVEGIIGAGHVRDSAVARWAREFA